MNNFKTSVFTLPSGAQLEIETLEDVDTGAYEVSSKRTIPILSDILKPIGEFSNTLIDSLKSSANRPNKISVEFSASLKGETKLLIVSGETQGSLKVQLTWENNS